MIVIFPHHNAPEVVVNKLKEHVGDSEFESLPLAINRLEELQFDGGEIACCTFVPINK